MKIYSIVENLNTPIDNRIWVPQNSQYKIAIKAVQNGGEVALSSVKLFDGNTEISADADAYAGYKTFTRNSTSADSKELTVKVLGQDSKLFEVVTDSTVFEVGGEGGSEYVLPVASDSTLGGIKVGEGLTIAEDGTLSADAQEYELPKASSTTLGGVKVGNGLGIDENGVLSANGYELPIASSTTLGGIKVGEGLDVAEDGTLSVSENDFVMKTNAVAVLSGTYEDDTTFQISAYVKA